MERECLQGGLSPLQARVVAGRVSKLDAPPDEIVRPRLASLNDPALLADAALASGRLAQAVARGERIGILTDYDVDGITSHAIIFEALNRYFGVPAGRIQHHIGHRIKDGYGVSEALAGRLLAQDHLPDVVITADCGSSDEPRLHSLAAAGIDVIVTDHHQIPAEGIPRSAFAVLNPTRADCSFPDRTVAGCMVSWLFMCETRRRLLEAGVLGADAPRLGSLLDFVALGTVADAVSLFGAGNRAVVLRGLKEMNRLKRPCWRALARLLERSGGFTVQDLGFQIGPRINARGRMADPYAALHFVLADDDEKAMRYLAQLDADNKDRRATEATMLESAIRMGAAQLDAGARALVVYSPDYHAGVQGIVASRLVDRFGCPAVVMSPARDEGQLSGSARSVKGFDIRAALQDVQDASPGLMRRFGGHAGAAGLSIEHSKLEEFAGRLAERVALELAAEELGPVVFTDGALAPEDFSVRTVDELEALAPYGREFESPLFEGEFSGRRLRRVGADGTHLSMELVNGRKQLRAIWFRAMSDMDDDIPVREGESMKVAFRLGRDDYRGGKAVQMIVEGVELSGREAVSKPSARRKKAPA